MTETRRPPDIPEEPESAFEADRTESFAPEPQLPAGVAEKRGTALATTLSGPAALEAAVEYATQKFAYMQRLTHVTLARTYQQDWTDMDGAPYLMAAGAERIAAIWGISVREIVLTREDRKDAEGTWYLYTAMGTFTLKMSESFGETTIMAMGQCSSRDRLFAQRKGPDGKHYWLPMEKVSEPNVRMKAYSNLYRNGVTRLLGLRNLTWDQLKQFGFERGKSSTVTFGGAAKEQPRPARDAGASSRPASTASKPQARRPDASKPPDGNTWFGSLQAAVMKHTGQAAAGDRSLALLRLITTFTPKPTDATPNPKPFDGFGSWEQLARSQNCERAATIAYKRLEAYLADLRAANRPAEVPTPAAGDSTPADPPQSNQEQTTLNGVPVGSEPPLSDREQSTNGGRGRR